jgi:CheY-like chemotaxis protein
MNIKENIKNLNNYFVNLTQKEKQDVFLRGMKIYNVLYVEDEELIRVQTFNAFGKMCNNIFVASNGKEALELYKENKEKIDIVISDINMPEMDGLTMAEHIREINEYIPIIFTSGQSDPKTLISIIDNNFDKIFNKPFAIKDLFIFMVLLIEQKKQIIKEKNIAKEIPKKMNVLIERQKTISLENNKLKERISYNAEIANDLILKIEVNNTGKIINCSKKFSKTFFKIDKDDCKDYSEKQDKTIKDIKMDSSTVIISSILNVLKTRRNYFFTGRIYTYLNNDGYNVECVAMPIGVIDEKPIEKIIIIFDVIL